MARTITTTRSPVIIRPGQEADALAYRELRLEALRLHPEAFGADYGAGGKGVSIVRLAVVTTNVAAIRCYLRCGFTVYGIEPEALRHDGAIYDALLMARKP